MSDIHASDDDLIAPSAEVEAPEQAEPEEIELILEGEEEPPPSAAPDNDLVRKLREEIKQRDRDIARLRPAVQAVEIGEKPTLEAHNYDEAAYDEALSAWLGRKAERDQQQAQVKAKQDAETKAFQDDNARYERKKAAMPVRDFDVAESAVNAALSPVQTFVILRGAESPERLVYALGKRPEKLAELAAIADPVRFAVAIAKLEGQIKVSSRQAPPPPESRPRGAAPFSAANADKHEQRLEAEADRTGDRTKIVAYRREKREREQQRRTAGGR